MLLDAVWLGISNVSHLPPESLRVSPPYRAKYKMTIKIQTLNHIRNYEITMSNWFILIKVRDRVSPKVTNASTELIRNLSGLLSGGTRLLI